MFKRYLGFFLILTMAGGVALINAYYIPTLAVSENNTTRPDSAMTASVPVKEPKVVYGMVVQDDHLVIEDKIKRNERLGDILMQYNVPANLIHELSTLSRKIFDPRKIAANKKYTLICDKDSLTRAKAMVYEPNAIDYIIFRFGDSLSVDVCKREVVTVEKTISGIIRSNLSETIEALGISHDLTNRFVDIFGWQVDFQRLQKGDKFKLIYQENQVEGTSIGIKQIDGIYFEHFGSEYYAFPFDQGDGLDYFDENGKSMRKALLKYPIEFTRISSRFTMNRFHPVQKRWKAHLGTDFAAPTGTPIRTVGDGIVLEAQYKSNNGNYVKIRHNGTYTTQYLHMSRIAAGVHAGMRVRQGQTIGYVGSTGLATGPHLCYRFWKNGKQVDALRAELPPSEPVKKEMMESFETVKQNLTEKLRAIPFAEEPAETIASIK
ncbi:peptidoglycan DD-metalloendopeptidase family protein [Fulvivirgaceae bacterium PWU4]|uniref:Peptidoglycan DD-metalloendopeptidase family protein n=1 Tax=Chryseosolibacter histidini TaxID=2782349 RepID=A0AAP2GT47_9BACT|nr:peptidoglycan DD-metalloendopeptidase family protein [Chryseosolibacter histidini]MBT1701287.1 peptidoglycan DD-metalloendopeptidase family protein [Chryseosolibacter histidini]